MKTLNNHTILYDEDCPLCNAYTSTFINTKMLDEEGRKPYCKISNHEREFVDIERAANEIALVDNEKNQVIYGIDSLLKIIGFSFPVIEKIGNFTPVNYLLRKLYSFISYFGFLVSIFSYFMPDKGFRFYFFHLFSQTH